MDRNSTVWFSNARLHELFIYRIELWSKRSWREEVSGQMQFFGAKTGVGIFWPGSWPDDIFGWFAKITGVGIGLNRLAFVLS